MTLLFTGRYSYSGVSESGRYSFGVVSETGEGLLADGLGDPNAVTLLADFVLDGQSDIIRTIHRLLTSDMVIGGGSGAAGVSFEVSPSAYTVTLASIPVTVVPPEHTASFSNNSVMVVFTGD